MKRSHLVGIFFGISAAVSGLVWFSFFSAKAQERHIKKEIADANYCGTASDCRMVVSSQCPFGCHIHVNKNEAARIGELLEGHESDCMYSCIELKGVECVNNTCKLVQ